MDDSTESKKSKLLWGLPWEKCSIKILIIELIFITRGRYFLVVISFIWTNPALLCQARWLMDTEETVEKRLPLSKVLIGLDSEMQANRLYHGGFQRMLLSDLMLSMVEKVKLCHLSAGRYNTLVRSNLVLYEKYNISDITDLPCLCLVTGSTDIEEELKSRLSMGLGVL